MAEVGGAVVLLLMLLLLLPLLFKLPKVPLRNELMDDGEDGLLELGATLVREKVELAELKLVVSLPTVLRWNPLLTVPDSPVPVVECTLAPGVPVGLLVVAVDFSNMASPVIVG